MNNGMNILPRDGSKRRHTIALRRGALLSLLLLAGACTKEPTAERLPGDTETVRLNPSAYIVAGTRMQSRAAISGGKFPSDGKRYPIGMWVCKHEETPTKFEPAMDGYGNLLASLGVEAVGENEWRDLWKYTFSGTLDGTTHDILSVQRYEPVDIYAYYPRQTDNGDTPFDPTAVPFTTGETDWMWAAPVKNGIAVDGKSTIDAPLHFSHAMTCLRVKIRCKYDGSVKLTSLTLTDSEGRLYKAGSMDIVEHKLSLNDADKTGKLALTYSDNTLVKTYKVFDIIMPPVGDYEDGQFELSFVFNDIAAQTSFKIPNTIPKDPNVPDIIETITAFEAGKRYMYSLTLDNRMKFEPIGIDDEWITVPDIELEL